MNQKPEHSLSLDELTGGQGGFEQPRTEEVSPGTQFQPQPATDLSPGASSSGGTRQPLDFGIATIPPSYAPSAEPIVGQPAVQTNPLEYVVQPIAPIVSEQPDQKETLGPEELRPVDSAKHDARPEEVRVQKNRWAQIRPILYGLSGFAVFVVLFNFQLIAQQIGYFLHPPKPAENTLLQDPNATTAATAIVPPENVIIIPKINVSAPVIFANSAVEDEVMRDLQDGVVHYVNTAKPGENGNAVIFGHSSNDWWEPGDFKFVFALLGKLEVGDQIQINYSSRKYVYEVSEKKVVAPTEVSVLNATPEPTLTLITCTPPGTAWQRLIIVAKQIQPVPNAKPPAEPIAVKEPTKQNASSDSKKQQTKEVAVTKPKPLPGNAPSIGQQVSKLFGRIASFFTPSPTTTSPASSPPPTTQPRLPEVS